MKPTALLLLLVNAACATFDPKSCFVPTPPRFPPSCVSRADMGRTVFHWDHQDVCRLDAGGSVWSCPYKEGTR